MAGPYGDVLTLPNLGETPFAVLDAAFTQHGAVQLTSEFRGRSLLRTRRATWMFFPPRALEAGGVTGSGRVLVCTNYHWLADRHFWVGGKFEEPEGRPKILLLNFVATALAARVRWRKATPSGQRPVGIEHAL